LLPCRRYGNHSEEEQTRHSVEEHKTHLRTPYPLLPAYEPRYVRSDARRDLSSGRPQHSRARESEQSGGTVA
jgi:hypothetical protein